METSLRPITRADIPAWTGLLAAAEEVDRTGEHWSSADLEEDLDNPETKPQDVIGAFHGSDLVGFAWVLPRGVGQGVFRVLLDGSVLPTCRGRGIGTALVRAMLDRAREVHAAAAPALPGMATVSGLTGNTAQADLLTSAGMTAERWSFVMRTALGDLPPAQPLPDGYQIRAYVDEMADALRETHNVAFLDHPGSTPWTEAMWKHFVTESRSFRPALTHVAVRTGSDEIVSYLQSAENEAHLEVTGRREAYVARVGTVRAHRGRGLAGALLGHALHGYADAGYDEASLVVDSENPTGALGVYRRAGFEVESKWAEYALTWPPVTTD